MKRPSSTHALVVARRTATREARLAQPQPRSTRIPAGKGAGSYQRRPKHAGSFD